MRALRYTIGGDARLGRLDDLTVVDAGPAGPLGIVPSPETWRALEAADGDRLPLGDVTVLYPTEPRKIMAVGLNYRDHAEESELEIPPVPVVFAKWPSSLISP
jgi:2-keto-4-pentenoate hydratase/2-oxohepta-3-ene-1,7-dioic acid hydratase in catechol pathway